MVWAPCNLYSKEPFPQSHAGLMDPTWSSLSLSLSLSVVSFNAQLIDSLAVKICRWQVVAACLFTGWQFKKDSLPSFGDVEEVLLRPRWLEVGTSQSYGPILEMFMTLVLLILSILSIAPAPNPCSSLLWNHCCMGHCGW